MNNNWNPINILSVDASTVGNLNLDVIDKSNKILDELHENKFEIIFLLGQDNLDFKKKDEFIIYQGSHGDRGANRADVILPSCAFSEESGIYVNTEGRPQISLKACEKIGEARENWVIIRALSEKLNCTIEYDNLIQLREKLFLEYPNLSSFNEVKKNNWINSFKYSKECLKFDLKNIWRDHYLTNPIARSSTIMAELSKNKQK